MYLALYDHSYAQIIAEQNMNHRGLFLTIQTREAKDFQSSKFVPCNLAQTYQFDQIVREISRKNLGKTVIFCAGENTFVQMKTIFLIGAHLILTYRVDADAAATVFESLNDPFEGSLSFDNLESIRNCWYSLACAQKMNWLDFWAVFETQDDHDGCIKLDEYVHYTR